MQLISFRVLASRFKAIGPMMKDKTVPKRKKNSGILRNSLFVLAGRSDTAGAFSVWVSGRSGSVALDIVAS